MVGGVFGLVGAKILQPRAGKFDHLRKPKENEFQPHNVPLVVLGTLILWFGWQGFNAGSTVSVTGSNTLAVAVVSNNTTLAAAAGGLTAFILTMYLEREESVVVLSNGLLAGLVSVTAPCSNVEKHNAIIIGIIGGVILIFSSRTLKKLKIDDPLDAFSVHGACGAWGVLAVGLFDKDVGLFHGHTHGIWPQILGLIVIVAWTAILSAIIFLTLNHFGRLRIDQEIEEKGFDSEFHGGNA